MSLDDSTGRTGCNGRGRPEVMSTPKDKLVYALCVWKTHVRRCAHLARAAQKAEHLSPVQQ
eukprot:5402464-Amphidinium_carterae.1